MKILVVVSELPPTTSGVALSCAQLVDGYRSAGHEVDAVCRTDFPTLTVGELRLALPLFHRHPLLQRRNEYDVVHLHGPAPAFIDALLFVLAFRNRRQGPHVVYTHHFDIDFPIARPLCRLYGYLTERLAHRVCDAIVVTTHAYARKYANHPRVSVIPWAGDHRPLRNGSAAEGDAATLRILFVGQQRRYKGVKVLLKALRTVDAVQCTIVGGGPRLARHKALADKYRLQGTEFTDLVTDSELDRILSESDVIVLPSMTRLEAFGVVLVEGMRYGCVPVASNLPGLAEVIGESGLLTEPGDHLELAQALRRLRDDAELRARLSILSVERARTFGWEQTKQDYVDLLEGLVRTRRKRLESEGLA